jgi:hypothetical protein
VRRPDTLASRLNIASRNNDVGLNVWPAYNHSLHPQHGLRLVRYVLGPTYTARLTDMLCNRVASHLYHYMTIVYS